MTEQEQTDKHILKLWATDQNKAFRLLLDQYQERLYWHIRSIVNSHQNADDVCQNTFIKVFKNLNRFESQSGLYTWIYRIATNESIDLLRKQKRKRTEDLADHQEFIGGLYTESSVDSDKILSVLNLALEELPEKQRQVFQMRYFGQKSYEEISEWTETSVGGLKANYHHAVKKIMAFIKERNTIL